MSPKCSAPKVGHVAGGAANCPVHGGTRGATPPTALPRPGWLPPVDLGTRRAAAEDPAVSHGLAALARDSAAGVRRRVAENPSTPPSLVETLRVDANPMVRRAVAERSDLSSGSIFALAMDRHASVRSSVVANPTTPGPILLALSTDTNATVRDAALAACNERICDAFAIAPSNAPAIESLREQAWWEMTPESSEVVLAKVLFPDA